MSNNEQAFVDDLKKAESFEEVLKVEPICQPPEPVLECANPYIQQVSDGLAFAQEVQSLFTEFQSNPFSFSFLNQLLNL